MSSSTVLFALGGLVVGAAGVWLLLVPLYRERLARALGESDLLRERITDLEGAAAQDRELAATLGPLAGSLGRVEQQVHALERDRVHQLSQLTEQLTLVREQTSALAGALRSPTSRGVWGEVQLRRVVEHAGMLARVDFTPQPQAMTPDGAGVRPDLVVHLPGGKQVVVDAKAPLTAFLEASELPLDRPDGANRRAQAGLAHARALRAHVEALAAKEYWRAFEPTPELVICFVPGEAFLAEACSADPSLLEHAMARRVVLATPTTLLALLRTVALTWQSEVLTGSAREVFTVGRELYSRLAGLGGHALRLGRSLERAVEDYNSLVGTLERRVLVSARRLTDLGLTDEALPAPTPLRAARRPLSAPELIDDAAG
ncbi:MAG: DNA recombination protein RmuC [Kineosporiaceae bacterium]|nr:DNA recombination protein RmuC [Kineosporiaceae bacterium]